MDRGKDGLDGETAPVLPPECSENTVFGKPVQICSTEGEGFISRSEGSKDGVWVDTVDVALASAACGQPRREGVLQPHR